MNISRLLRGGFISVRSRRGTAIKNEVLVSRDIYRKWKSTHFHSIGEMPITQPYDNTQMFPEVYGGPVCFSFYGIPICIDLIPVDDGVVRMAVMLRVDGDRLSIDEI